MPVLLADWKRGRADEKQKDQATDALHSSQDAQARDWPEDSKWGDPVSL